MNLEKNYIVNSLIVLREEFDDWAVLFDPDTGEAQGLDPTGVYIWKQLDGEKSVADIAKNVQETFNAVPESVSDDVNEFLSDLEKRGYIANA